MSNITDQTREDYLHTAAELLSEYHLQKLGYAPESGTYRISCGFARGRQRKDLVVFKREQSTANVNEIFISPHESDTHTVLTLLARGLTKAARDCAHAGSLSADQQTIEGLDKVCEMVELAAGPYPHAAVKKPPKGDTRQLKCSCNDCGAVWRASRKWVDRMNCCPCCVSGNIELDGSTINAA